jgi:hypothetical protein
VEASARTISAARQVSMKISAKMMLDMCDFITHPLNFIIVMLLSVAGRVFCDAGYKLCNFYTISFISSKNN